MKSWIDYLKVYEPGKPIEEVARELGFDDLESIIKVASNENEWGPSPKAIEAMQRVIEIDEQLDRPDLQADQAILEELIAEQNNQGNQEGSQE